ncbi:hypothetical protein ACHAXM_008092 [Skeletonema potamos]|jgi:hypothetical protein
MLGEAAYRSPVRSPVRKPRRCYSASPMKVKHEVYCASPVRELRSLCKERGLKVSGAKEEVIERLIYDDEVLHHTDAADRAAQAATQKISTFRRNICVLASIIVAVVLNPFMLDRSFEHSDSISTTPALLLGRASQLMRRTLSNVRPIIHITQQQQQQQHRGKVIGARVTGKDLEEAYQAIKKEYASLALTKTAKWKVLSTHPDGSQVSLLKHKTDPSCPYVRMTSIMPASVEEVWDFLSLDNWPKTMPKMDPFYEGLTVLGEYKHKGIEMRLARKTLKRIVAFGKRDFTFVSVSDHPRSDGAWVSGTVSVVTDQIPRSHGYTRAFQDSIAFYEPLTDDESGKPRTKLTIVFRIDLNDSSEGGNGGFVPMWMYVKTVGTTGMLSVQNMKKQLLLMTAEQDNGKCELNWLDRLINTSKCES